MNNRLANLILKNAEIALSIKFPAESLLRQREWPEVLGLMSASLKDLDEPLTFDYFNNSIFSRFFDAFAPDLLPYILEKSAEEFSFDDKQKKE